MTPDDNSMEAQFNEKYRDTVFDRLDDARSEARRACTTFGLDVVAADLPNVGLVLLLRDHAGYLDLRTYEPLPFATVSYTPNYSSDPQGDTYGGSEIRLFDRGKRLGDFYAEAGGHEMLQPRLTSLGPGELEEPPHMVGPKDLALVRQYYERFDTRKDVFLFPSDVVVQPALWTCSLDEANLVEAVRALLDNLPPGFVQVVLLPSKDVATLTQMIWEEMQAGRQVKMVLLGLD